MRSLGTALFVAIAMLAPGVQASIPSDALLQKLEPQGKVNDFAGILTPAERAALESRVAELQRKTGAQFAVVTLKSLEGGQVQDFTNKLFAKWGVGEKGKNNGIMLLVAIEDRKFWMEVGYGLEPILPDALAGRVLDEKLVPAFKQQRYGDGLAQAVNRAAEILERGEPAPPEARRGGKGLEGEDPVRVVLFLSLFVASGAFVTGIGIRTRACFFILWGLMFGGIPTGMVWGASFSEGWGLWAPLTVTVLGLAMVVVGARIPWNKGKKKAKWGGWSSSGTGSSWTWAGGSVGSSSSSWGGGFSGGGGFGGGCSGGGGAGGSW